MKGNLKKKKKKKKTMMLGQKISSLVLVFIVVLFAASATTIKGNKGSSRSWTRSTLFTPVAGCRVCRRRLGYIANYWNIF